MYPRNAASPERIAIGPVILIADGTPQSASVVVTVRGQGGAEAGSAGTIAYGATGVIVYYTPTQAETDFTSFTVIASKADCIPACVTIVTSASTVPGRTMPADGSVTAAVIANNAIDAATFAADVDAEILSYIVDDATRIDASDLNTEIDAWKNGGRLDLILDIIAADTTTDIPAILGAPAGASMSADIAAVKVDTAAILVDTGTTLDGRIPAALTAGGFMKSDVLAVDGSTAAAARMERALETEVLGTCDTGSSTTAIIASSVVPASVVNDQWNGLIMKFDLTTTTTALRGQGTRITDYVHATLTFTVDALTTAPVSGDTFVIV